MSYIDIPPRACLTTRNGSYKVAKQINSKVKAGVKSKQHGFGEDGSQYAHLRIPRRILTNSPMTKAICIRFLKDPHSSAQNSADQTSHSRVYRARDSIKLLILVREECSWPRSPHEEEGKKTEEEPRANSLKECCVKTIRSFEKWVKIGSQLAHGGWERTSVKRLIEGSILGVEVVYPLLF